MRFAADGDRSGQVFVGRPAIRAPQTGKSIPPPTKSNRCLARRRWIREFRDRVAGPAFRRRWSGNQSNASACCPPCVSRSPRSNSISSSDGAASCSSVNCAIARSARLLVIAEDFQRILQVRGGEFQRHASILTDEDNRKEIEMKIGIIGSGNVGGALGGRWAKLGHEVVFGTRNPASGDVQKLAARASGKTSAATLADTAREGEVLLLATPWLATQEIIAGARRPEWENPD